MGFFGAGHLSDECDKAARILKGFIGTISVPFLPSPNHSSSNILASPNTEKSKITSSVIQNAQGLAIFSTIRAAMWIGGTGGSGIVVARLPDGSWSAPSAFSVRSGGIGVVLGMDVYDCVCVLNTHDAVAIYMNSETSLGAGATLAAGPIGGISDVSSKDVKPVWTYTKSCGLYGGLSIDGTVVNEKADTNAKGYGKSVSARQILKGEVE